MDVEETIMDNKDPEMIQIMLTLSLKELKMLKKLFVQAGQLGI